MESLMEWAPFNSVSKYVVDLDVYYLDGKNYTGTEPEKGKEGVGVRTCQSDGRLGWRVHPSTSPQWKHTTLHSLHLICWVGKRRFTWAAGGTVRSFFPGALRLRSYGFQAPY